MEIAKEKRARDFAYSGEMVKDTCPVCGKRLMRNWLKHEWCSNFECDYFVREGKAPMLSAYIRMLNFKHSKSE